MRDTLTREDELRAKLGLAMDTPAKRREYVRRITDKWANLGWLNQEDAGKGHKEFAKRADFPKLDSEYKVREMALILENQMFFQNENRTEIPVHRGSDGKLYATLTQDTSTADEALPTRAVMPLIRRIYAIVLNNDISRVQTMAGPNSYVFWLDFLRESDSSNLLSIEYNALLTAELGVPPKGKLQLRQRQISAVKQMVGVTWSTEAEEDAKALLNFAIETELMREFGNEFVRDLFMRHITTIYNAANGNYDPSIGANLPGIFQNHLPAITFANKGGSTTDTDYKQQIYATALQADAQFMRANRIPPKKIMCGYGMGAFLQSLNTATGSTNASGTDFSSSLGFSNYGQYAARWQIVATEFLPDNVGIMYTPNPDALHAGHVYAPYVPVQASPKIYADYDPNTGNFQLKDAWTRTLRERSAEVVTKPYAYQLLVGPPGGFSQF